jgi:hypothetical protein
MTAFRAYEQSSAGCRDLGTIHAECAETALDKALSRCRRRVEGSAIGVVPEGAELPDAETRRVIAFPSGPRENQLRTSALARASVRAISGRRREMRYADE